MYFDEKLKALRLKQGLSLAELAAKLSIPENRLDCLETGFCDPGDDDWEKITGFFGVAREALTDDQPAAAAFSVLFGQDSFPVQLTAVSQAVQLPPVDVPSPLIKKITLSDLRLAGGNVVREDLPEWLTILSQPENEYVAIKVPDSRLSAIGIFAGDIAIICLKEHVPAGKIAAYWQSGRLILRQSDGSGHTYGQVTEIRKIL